MLSPTVRGFLIFHIAQHFIVPLAVAVLFFPKQWRKAYLIMMLTMLVDVDHLLADPIYDPNRCSIGFHPLHRLPMIIGYLVLCIFSKTRWIGLGLVIHMALDSIDCQVNTGSWIN
ncbi:DUF6122 family protein [uncultured Pseudoteredinibacter sp.]|uniref:DUF6122 family protein n=1 Tax=uncultured Pseudoteredinibacter sp. TaxID=1641701 RepID=UPI00262B8C0A|nr:DUF6122 family protein [uncultured Pseudoteredinibacter sp.]